MFCDWLELAIPVGLVSSGLGGQLFVHLHIQSSPVQCTWAHMCLHVGGGGGVGVPHVMWWMP